MHPDTVDSETINPGRAHPHLLRAREILRLRSTRAKKLERRKDALRLYMNALPTDLLTEIFLRFSTNIYTYVESRNSLLACSLVCRKWSFLAQKRLHHHLLCTGTSQLLLLRRTLRASNLFGGSVRRFTVSFTRGNLPQSPIPIDRMIADCLERTPNLKQICLQIFDPACLTNALIPRLRELPQLETFQLNQYNYRHRPVTTSGFDPRLLHFLPRTVERIMLARPFLDLVQVLPEFLRRVYPPGEALAQPNRGLKHLDILNTVADISNAIDVPSLISTTSIAATLTSLCLRIYPIEGDEHLPWNNFLGACDRLQEYSISTTLITPLLFQTMPVLEQLRVLNIIITSHPSELEWEGFRDSILNYVTQTPCLTDFELKGNFNNYHQGTIDYFIRNLPAKLFTGNRCRLRSFSFRYLLDDIPLDKIEEIGPEEFLRSSHFVTPSIYAFENLCMRATGLEHLNIAVPLDFLPAVTRALQKLKHLRTIILNNSFLSIDPGVPLRKMNRYKKIFHCLKLLKQHWSSRDREIQAAEAELEELEQEQQEEQEVQADQNAPELPGEQGEIEDQGV